MLRSALIIALAFAASAAAAEGGTAETLRRYPAPEARQGVAVGPKHLYAVTNSMIAKYDKAGGAKLAEWRGDPKAYPHINACALIRRELICASSNYPATPHVSTVEVFNPGRMIHKRSIPLPPGLGSVTWIDRHDGAWWALFANYDGKGGEPPRDHRDTVLVRFDDAWRRTGLWTFPEAVLARFRPTSSSGGGWGPDGRLYVTGHDHPELYVLRLPKAGGVLEDAGVIAVDIEGQAIDWDESRPGVLYGISRHRGEIVAMRVTPPK